MMHVALFDGVPGMERVCMRLGGGRIGFLEARFYADVRAPDHSGQMASLVVRWSPWSGTEAVCARIGEELRQVCPTDFPVAPNGDTVAARALWLLQHWVVPQATRIARQQRCASVDMFA